jgi:hypothetical protein
VSDICHLSRHTEPCKGRLEGTDGSQARGTIPSSAGTERGTSANLFLARIRFHRMPAITKDTYKKYLASPEWKKRRKKHFGNLENGLCQRCELPRWLSEIAYRQDLHVHHVVYRELGQERPEDLESLCARCHEIETFGRSDFPEIPSSICCICGVKHWNKRSSWCEFCLTISLIHPRMDLFKILDANVVKSGPRVSMQHHLEQLIEVHRTFPSITTENLHDSGERP